MSAVTHINFDLIFSRASDAYLARVIESPSGSAALEFKAPFLDVELENVMLRVSRFGQAGRRTKVVQIDSARDIGGRLFEAVFAGAVRDCYRASLAQLTADQGLRIRLRLTDVPEIARWPWEFLFDASQNRFLALSHETPIVRYMDFPEPVELLAVNPPLRVLLMVSSPSDYPALDVERECANLESALAGLTADGRLELDRVDVATLGQLQRALSHKTYHILHFIGHGGAADGTSEGHLMFEDKDERGYAVDGSTLGTLLHNHQPMRIAVLNACEGARTSGRDPFAGVAQRLVQQGIPCVVAMQFEISDDAAIQFSTEFYAGLAAGQPVDRAVALGRLAIYSEVSDLEWATPVLYLRAPDARIFATPVAPVSIIGPPIDPKDLPPPARDDRVHPLDARARLWAACTFASLVLATGISIWTLVHLLFNLVSLRAAATAFSGLGPVISLATAVISALVYFLTGESRTTAVRAAHWVSLTADGRPSLRRLAGGLTVSLLCALAVWFTPPVGVGERPGDLADEAGWRWINATNEGRPEIVHREVDWWVAPGHRNDLLRLEVRVEPYDFVMFGKIQAPANLLNDAVHVPRPGTREPLVVQGLTASWPWQRDRLRFKIVRDSAVEETPPYVQVDVRILDDHNTVLAQQCRSMPARWSSVPGTLVPGRCPPIR